jgi:FixJ family two-component response regulator
MVVAGMLNKQIAAELGTAESTVKIHNNDSTTGRDTKTRSGEHWIGGHGDN